MTRFCTGHCKIQHRKDTEGNRSGGKAAFPSWSSHHLYNVQFPFTHQKEEQVEVS